MKTDRELLELAAKAAGYDISHYWNAERLRLDPPVNALCIPGVSTGWDPLENDGHALRLAVKLDMQIIVNRVDGFVLVIAGYNGDIVIEEEFGDYMYAATRRAITRAAAQIQLEKEQDNGK